MTQEQESLVRELRVQGVGYMAIAKAIGLTRDQVRNYSVRHNLGGFGTNPRVNVEELLKNRQCCQYCGKTYENASTGRPRRFCNDSCRRNWWQKNPEAHQRKESAKYLIRCERCGVDFISYGNKMRKYCSHNCYIKQRFWQD